MLVFSTPIVYCSPPPPPYSVSWDRQDQPATERDGVGVILPHSIQSSLLRSQGIGSQPGGPVRKPYLSYRPARLPGLAESIPGLHKRLQIRALYYVSQQRYRLLLVRRKLPFAHWFSLEIHVIGTERRTPEPEFLNF
jgi:hypothetical protein